jgi:hypothetical protein
MKMKKRGKKMQTNKIQEKIVKKKEEIEVLEKQLKGELAKNNESEWISIPGTDYEVTKEVLYKGKSYDEIMQLKKPDEELLNLKMIGIICEHPELLKELKMDSSSTKDNFFFKQPFPQNEKKGYIARFYAGSYYANLGCDWYADDSYSYLGVRFVRKISKGHKLMHQKNKK